MRDSSYGEGAGGEMMHFILLMEQRDMALTLIRNKILTMV